MITGKNYIGNQLEAEGTSTFRTLNPELNENNPWIFTEATTNEIEKAVTLAAEAFKVYKNYSGKQKADFLNAIANEILALGDDLLLVYSQESGLPRGRAEGERGRTIGQIKAFAAMLEEGSWVEATIDTALPNRTPMPRVDLRKMLVPIGPVVVFGSSNFPLAFSTCGGDTVSALASGCSVLVKSHSMHVATGEMVASAINKAAQKTNMPNGVFSNLIGKGNELGTTLVKHPLVKAVGFTGSIAGGKALYSLAAQRQEPIPVFAEMGSVNPVVILPEALQVNAEKWAKSYASSITLGTGQFCTNPGLILGIKSDGFSMFKSVLASEIMKINPSCMLHSTIKNSYDIGKQKQKQHNEVTVVAEYEGDLKSNYASQAVVSVSGKAFLANKALSHEVFGPFSIVVECENVTELETVIENLEGQLTGTILSENNEIRQYKNVIATLKNKVGRLIFNGVPTGVEVCAAMAHGGPFPASTDSRFTAIGIHSVKRWVRPVSYQDWPNELLPAELKNENPLNIFRTINNTITNTAIS